MKYVIVIADGMADGPVEELHGRTPLEHVDLPHFNVLAGAGLGCVRTIPIGLPAGSDTAILSILGYDPRIYYQGRSSLEAAGYGIALGSDDVSLRVNLVTLTGDDFASARIVSHNSGDIGAEEADRLIASLDKNAEYAAAARELRLSLAAGHGFRRVGVIHGASDIEAGAIALTEPHSILGRQIEPYLPGGALAQELTRCMDASYRCLREHPVNKARDINAKPPANCLWPWGAGKATALQSFRRQHRVRAAAISAVPLVMGIAELGGMRVLRLAGATGGLDTDFKGKAMCALDALASDADLAIIHIEAPDECAHEGDVKGKCEALRRIDGDVVATLLDDLGKITPAFRILLISDHYTRLCTRSHDDTPVPYCVYDSRTPMPARKFTENAASSAPVLEEGHYLLSLLLERIG